MVLYVKICHLERDRERERERERERQRERDRERERGRERGGEGEGEIDRELAPAASRLRRFQPSKAQLHVLWSETWPEKAQKHKRFRFG